MGSAGFSGEGWRGQKGIKSVTSAGGTGCPIQMMFARIFGVHTFDLPAQAVAMISLPGGMPIGAVFPLAAAPGPFIAFAIKSFRLEVLKSP